jgi:hypothetical protein
VTFVRHVDLAGDTDSLALATGRLRACIGHATNRNPQGLMNILILITQTQLRRLNIAETIPAESE